MSRKEDLNKKTDADISKELKDKREALRNFKFSMWGSKTRDTKEGKNVRKQIARRLTALKERESSK